MEYDQCEKHFQGDKKCLTHGVSSLEHTWAVLMLRPPSQGLPHPWQHDNTVLEHLFPCPLSVSLGRTHGTRVNKGLWVRK